MLTSWLVAIWIILSLILSKKGQSYLLDFPLFIASVLLLSSNLGTYININLIKVDFLFVWGVIILWFYLRRKDLNLVWKLEDLFWGLVIGLGIGIFSISVFGTKSLLVNLDQNVSIITLSNITIQKAAAEEFVFRLLLINYLRKFGIPDWIVNILQSVAFGVGHYSGFPSSLPRLLFAVVTGYIMGVLAIKQKSILSPMAIHIAINLLFLFFYLRS